MPESLPRVSVWKKPLAAEAAASVEGSMKSFVIESPPVPARRGRARLGS